MGIKERSQFKVTRTPRFILRGTRVLSSCYRTIPVAREMFLKFQPLTKLDFRFPHILEKESCKRAILIVLRLDLGFRKYDFAS